jgi:hypothetical protein
MFSDTGNGERFLSENVETLMDKNVNKQKYCKYLAHNIIRETTKLYYYIDTVKLTMFL